MAIGTNALGKTFSKHVWVRAATSYISPLPFANAHDESDCHIHGIPVTGTTPLPRSKIGFFQELPGYKYAAPRGITRGMQCVTL